MGEIGAGKFFSKFFRDIWNVFKKDELALEIAQIAIPTALALMADPIASLVDTAFIGHEGPLELAAVGVSIAIFNQVTKIAIYPLVSITISFVAEEDSVEKPKEVDECEKPESCLAMENELEELIPQMAKRVKNAANVKQEKRKIRSATSALIIGCALGLVETLFLIFSGKHVLSFMGVNSDSPMFIPARQYLTLRSLGAPAVLLSLAMQGIFRGIVDTKTPLYATIAGDLVNIVLDPILIFVCGMGVSGAAIAHAVSQYFISLILMSRLMKQVDLLPPNIGDLQLSRFLKSGSLLLARVVAATCCVTLAASLAAREGEKHMAAFQVCLQIWLATSLLTDGLAIAGQTVLASAFAKKDYDKVKATVIRVLQMGLVLGLVLAFAAVVVLQLSSILFTTDVDVLHLISIGIPFVAVTQPINALAFVFDGVNFGASDFAYCAYSMVLVAIMSILCLLVLSSSFGFVGIWVALSTFMTLRTIAGFLRIWTGTGPWRFLRC